MDQRTDSDEAGWPLRPWLLLALGAALGLAIQQLGDLPDSGSLWGKRLVSAAIIFLGASGAAFGLSWLRGRHLPALVMALVCGVIAGGVMLWNGPSQDPYVFWTWPLASGVIASAVLLVLFQAAQARHRHFPEQWSVAGLRDWKRRALGYADVHEAAWTDALLLGLSATFAGIVMAIAFLLSEMFMLVKIDLLRELLRKGWVDALIIGGAYGGAMGLLRERTPIIAALQRVAMMVLRVLAPVLAVGLVAFLLVLPFTGLAPLWATGNTTPIMLAAALVALFLVNAVIGDSSGDAAISRPLRWGGRALGLALLPLVLIAAWSTGLRIGQHGLSPDRLWAVTFIVMATVTAVTYVFAIARPGAWSARLYRSNLHLALILGGVALILSTGLIGFERISTASQIARLKDGRVKPLDFDYRGLWFDFGPPGRAAIERLAKSSPDGQVRRFAADVQKLENRFVEASNVKARRSGAELDKRLTILPGTVTLEPALRARLADYDACQPSGACTLRYSPGEDYAVVVRPADPGCTFCQVQVTLLYRGKKGDWGAREADPNRIELDDLREDNAKKAAAIAAAVRAGRIEMRSVTRRQLFIDGKPYGAPIPPENASDP